VTQRHFLEDDDPEMERGKAVVDDVSSNTKTGGESDQEALLRRCSLSEKKREKGELSPTGGGKKKEFSNRI